VPRAMCQDGDLRPVRAALCRDCLRARLCVMFLRLDTQCSLPMSAHTLINDNTTFDVCMYLDSFKYLAYTKRFACTVGGYAYARCEAANGKNRP
jgi:hypothetical protein